MRREHSRRRLPSIAGLQRLFAASWVVGALIAAGCSSPTPEEIERGIASAPFLREANILCSDVSAPARLVLVEKSVAVGRDHGIVEYRYRGEVNPGQILSFYAEQFRRLDWSRESFDPGLQGAVFASVRFRDGIRFVSITNVRSAEVDYIVACGISRRQ